MSMVTFRLDVFLFHRTVLGFWRSNSRYIMVIVILIPVALPSLFLCTCTLFQTSSRTCEAQSRFFFNHYTYSIVLSSQD